MADSKISALTDGGNLQGSDQVAINRGGTNYRAVALQDGWIDDTAETWTYATGSGGGTATFTVAADVTAKYKAGTRIKLTQTTVKYFVVTKDSTVSSGTTTVTIMAGTDYTLANAAISANYHSYAASPQGYPGWFNFTDSTTGVTTVTKDIARFCVVGRECTIAYDVAATSNATTKTFTVPITIAQTALYSSGFNKDNGVTATGPARVVATSGGSTITLTHDLSGTAWTNGGTWEVAATFTYEI